MRPFHQAGLPLCPSTHAEADGARQFAYLKSVAPITESVLALAGGTAPHEVPARPRGTTEPLP